MVGALALHAVFEGLVFGISKESAKEMFGTILAVVIHKDCFEPEIEPEVTGSRW